MYDFVDEILGNIFEIELYVIEKPFDADNVSFAVTGKLKLFEVSISKNAKAKESGIPIISETEFTAMFGDPSEFDLEQSEFWESFAELLECYEDFDETIKVLYAYSNWIKKGDLDRAVRTILSIAGEHDEDVQEELVELVKQLESSKKTCSIKLPVQTVDKGHECHKMFVAFSIRIFKEIVGISTLKLVFTL